MTYLDLMADHYVIEALAHELLDLARAPGPQIDAASDALQMLAEAVRDHLAVEDPMLYATAIAVDGSRHDGIVTATIGDLEALKECWTRYLYRWDRPHITRAWALFGEETEIMLDLLKDRVARETAILYSLALHHGVIQVGQ